MSKYLNISTGDYKVTVKPGGKITLNTGVNQGQVVITGDLVVQGNTTTINTANLDIEDNVVYLNSGESPSHPGITSVVSGIQINRGSLSDAQLVFDESVEWYTATANSGAFAFRDESGSLVGVRTNSISTGGGDLYLINSGTGVISVAGTVDYETNVVDDDHIPNKKYVDNSVQNYFGALTVNQVVDGVNTSTYIRAQDIETTGLASRIVFGIDNQPVAVLYGDRLELNRLLITGTELSPVNPGDNLTLSAPGTGSVVVSDALLISQAPYTGDAAVDQAAPVSGVKLYVKPTELGNLGLYYVSSDQTRDELISKNKALLYGMLF